MDPAQRQPGLADLRQKLVALTAEVVQTEDELAALESDGQLTLGATPASAVQIPRMPAEKNALFLDLFGPRRAVYPKRWESSKTGKGGYSPACGNDSFANRLSGICQKPKVKCAECCHQRFPSLDEHAIEAHLRGEQTLGVYAIGTDATCRFLLADFDGEGGRDDVLAYRESSDAQRPRCALQARAPEVNITIDITRFQARNGNVISATD